MLPNTRSRQEIFFIDDGEQRFVTRSKLMKAKYPLQLWQCWEDDNGRVLPAFHITPQILYHPPTRYTKTIETDRNAYQRALYAQSKAEYTNGH